MYKNYLSILFFFVSILSFGQNIHFHAIGVENGISQPTVTSIYCGDKNGHIYIRCKYAVVQYDIKKKRFLYYLCTHFIPNVTSNPLWSVGQTPSGNRNLSFDCSATRWFLTMLPCGPKMMASFS